MEHFLVARSASGSWEFSTSGATEVEFYTVIPVTGLVSAFPGRNVSKEPVRDGVTPILGNDSKEEK